MVFSSLPFLFIFLPLCLLLYYLLPGLKWKNGVLIVMSLVFYATGEPVYVLLLILCALLGWLGGLAIEHCKERRPGAVKPVLWITVILTLSFLFVFKYLDFVIGNLNLLPFVDIKPAGLSLPIGISFYTFQTLSYDIDLARGKARVQRSFASFLLFVSLFPQLIAGPILRYTDIQEQLDDRHSTVDGFCSGISRFMTGCSKKVLLANAMGKLIDLFFGAGVGPGSSVLSVWLGVAAFTLQIYFDFSGYSDMAIGLGKMFGFEYCENFDHPYIARSVTDFWRRWHISLSSFFRDYVYIPLGGNRRHQVLNLFVVWALTGLWHGSSWNFVLWGLYYFVFLVLEKFLFRRRIEKIPVLSNIITILIVMVGWAIFYFEDIGQCLTALGIMFGFGSSPLWESALTTPFINNIPLLLIAALCCLPIGKPVAAVAERLKSQSPGVWFVCTALYQVGLLFVCTASLVSSSYNPFLYFRF